MIVELYFNQCFLRFRKCEVKMMKTILSSLTGIYTVKATIFGTCGHFHAVTTRRGILLEGLL
jgi:hypothetical protein